MSLKRIEQAEGGEQRELLEEAYRLIFPWAGGGSGSKAYADYWDAYEPFERLLDAEAYLDAVMMLLPEGWWLSLNVMEGNYVSLCKPGTDLVCDAAATTPALAILAAILRTQEPGHER